MMDIISAAMVTKQAEAANMSRIAKLSIPAADRPVDG